MAAMIASLPLSSRSAVRMPATRATKAVGARRRGAAMLPIRAGLVQQMNSEELEVAIAERSKPLVIDFYATWCGPCVMIAAELEKAAEELGDSVRFLKVNTEEEEDLASQLQIQALPTVVFVPAAADKQALRTEGLLAADVIVKIVRENCL